MEKEFIIFFYHPSAQQYQTLRVWAKNKHSARHTFWKKYPRNRVDIESIEEL